MNLLVLIVLLSGLCLASTTTEYKTTSDDFSNATEYSTLNFTTDDSNEGISEQTQGTPLGQYQDINNLRVYKGPLPKFPGTTTSPWIALHSPVKMYIPVRSTGENSEESEDCVHCPRNMIVYLHRQQTYILTPVPTISICSSFAHRAGRVHVAVVSGPRPGQRLYAGHYQVELMVWKAEGPVYSCNYTITVRMKRQAKVSKVPKIIFCPHPEHPSNGYLACDPSGRKLYPPNSVCQVFCESNYLIENSSRNSSTIVCRNGRWSPEDNITCVATFCPELPKLATHSYWSCDVDDSSQKFIRGTRCQINCGPGYVIPSSKSEEDTLVCTPPLWNVSSHISECTKAVPPKLMHCQNRHVIVKKGHSVKISESLLPKATSHAGVPLTPVCSTQGKILSKGKHQIICKIEDPELNTRRECSYRIHVEESSGPHPHVGDCKNRTVLANQKGFIRSKPVRFLVKVGAPERTKVLRGKCSPEGDLGIGNHFINCKATDPPTGVTGTCAYWLKIQKRSCKPPQKIINGRVICPSHDIGAVCHYECDAGYFIPDDHLTRSTKICQSNLRWHPPLNPACKIKQAELLDGCSDLEVELTPGDNFSIPSPIFLTALNETLNTSCTPSSVDIPGLHQISCVNDDDVFNVSCLFNVSVSLKNELTTATEASFPENSVPELIEGCNDLEVNASAPVHFTVPVPFYSTTSNETLNVSCTPSVIKGTGEHRILCIADDSISTVSCYFNVTVLLKDELTTETIPDTGFCKPLSPPEHSTVQCTSEEQTETCQVACDPGYGFPEEDFITAVCVRNPDGLWDFQKLSPNETLPDCLAQTEGSAVEVWISFEAFAPHCEDDLQEQMKDLMMNELCEVGTDCTNIAINCTLDEESDMMLMAINWTVQADFNDEEYYDDEEIPEAEIRLEAVMEKTRMFLASEEAPEGLQLFRDSFRRGHITLVCPKGFTPNMLMARCVECTAMKMQC